MYTLGKPNPLIVPVSISGMINLVDVSFFVIYYGLNLLEMASDFFVKYY